MLSAFERANLKQTLVSTNIFEKNTRDFYPFPVLKVFQKGLGFCSRFTKFATIRLTTNYYVCKRLQKMGYHPWVGFLRHSLYCVRPNGRTHRKFLGCRGIYFHLRQTAGWAPTGSSIVANDRRFLCHVRLWR